MESRLLRLEQVPIAFTPVLAPYESPMVVSDGLSTALSVTRLGIQAGVEVSTLLFEVLKIPETVFDYGAARSIQNVGKGNQAIAWAMSERVMLMV